MAQTIFMTTLWRALDTKGGISMDFGLAMCCVAIVLFLWFCYVTITLALEDIKDNERSGLYED